MTIMAEKKEPRTSFQFAPGMQEIMERTFALHGIKVSVNAALLLLVESPLATQRYYMHRIAEHEVNDEPIRLLSPEERIAALEAEAHEILRAVQQEVPKPSSSRRRDGGKAG
jgi:hypothetical protein